jgi:hypothetical protein
MAVPAAMQLVLVLGLAGAGTDSLRVVEAPSLPVYDTPDAEVAPSGSLAKGDTVRVRRREPDGWVAIDPPAAAFDLVDASGLERLEGGRARVVSASVAVRTGNPQSRRPGEIHRYLRRMTEVAVLDRPPLRVALTGGEQEWIAIRPLPGEMRFVRADGLAPASSQGSRSSSTRRWDVGFASLGREARWKDIPPEFAKALARVEARHRSALRGPLESWQIAGVRREYEALRDQSVDDSARALIAERLVRLTRQEEIARAARRFREALQRAQDHDLQVSDDLAPDRTVLAEAPFDAVGTLQVSAKEVDGRRVHALIGDDGLTAAYLVLPPAFPIKSYLTGRVGVRGTVRYDETLRARIIQVGELESLTEAP